MRHMSEPPQAPRRCPYGVCIVNDQRQRLLTRLTRRVLGRASRGQAVVETALALVLFVPIIVGAVDLGRAYFAYDVLVHAVNEGVRVGAFDVDTANVVAAVRDAGASLSLTSGNVTVTCYGGSSTTTKACASMAMGDSVKVSANVVFTPLTPLLASLMPGGDLTLVATAQRSFQ
jgi:hypothetical protein